MQIHVKGYLTLREQMGSASTFELPESSTLRDLLQLLPGEIQKAVEMDLSDPENRRQQRSLTILINGHSFTHLALKLDTPLKFGDEVAIFPPLAGGGY